MRILITTGIFPPDIGGPATYVPTIIGSAQVMTDNKSSIWIIAESLSLNCHIALNRVISHSLNTTQSLKH